MMVSYTFEEQERIIAIADKAIREVGINNMNDEEWWYYNEAKKVRAIPMCPKMGMRRCVGGHCMMWHLSNGCLYREQLIASCESNNSIHRVWNKFDQGMIDRERGRRAGHL